MSSLTLIKAWLVLSTWASVAGWLLSAVGQLNALGYLAFGCASCIGWFTLPRSWRVSFFDAESTEGKLRWCVLQRRFARWLPASFAVLALLVLISGLLYPPNNYSGLAYRTPRVLHWLSEGHWFWIHTPGYRMNDRACGFEWLTAPLLLFTRTDRFFFLLNFIPFLLFPSQIFSLFTRLGVRRRVAWHWMWLLPTGYSFLLQAASIGNDAFPTLYALAAVDFALRAQSSRRLSHVFYSLLAAALLTGAKPSNLPLLLPWGLLMMPLLGLLLRNPIRSFLVSVVASVVSFLPSALLNIHYCGDWSGLSLERAGMDMHSPIVGIWGNFFLFALHNLLPPFFPLASWWNTSGLAVLPRFITEPLQSNFESGFQMIWELPGEDWSGLGFGITLLALAAAASALLTRRRSGCGQAQPLRFGALHLAVLVSPWLALLAYSVKSGMVTGARLITPYYPLLLPSLLVLCGQSWVVRRKWFQVASGAVVLLSLAVLVVNPSRPLWPARTVLSRCVAAMPNARLANRALTVYTVYGDRSDPLATLREALPTGTRIVGFLADGDDLDISLWRPFFSRTVKHILLNDTRQQIRERGIEYAVVGGAYLNASKVDLQSWLRETGAELVSEHSARLKVSEGQQKWYIVRWP